MREQEPMTQTMKISDVKNTLSSLVNKVYRNETRVLVEKSGIPVAAIISADDLKRFAQLEREREQRFAVIDRVREAFKGVPAEEIEAETDRIIARNRAADRTTLRRHRVRRITLDANVLAPGFTSQSSASARLIDLWRSGAFELILSDHVLQELARTLADPYFATRLPRDDAAAILMLLSTTATVTELTVEVSGVATHPEDDAVLATALSGQATILCTRDKQLLKLRSYQSVIILSPGELLARFET